ncbi:MAG: FAD:protein FMN transferase [Burkholderiaceae bacterium]
MKRRQCLVWGWGLFTVGLSNSLLANAWAADRAASAGKLVWRERALLGFGTSLWIKAAHENADQLESALNAAVKSIRHIERQMSLFDPDSVISQLNRQRKLNHADRDLISVLNLSQQIARGSGGSFDISMQPLWQVWSRATEAHQLPSPKQVQAAQRLVNWRAIELSASTVRLNTPGMALSLNGVAQGYAADVARKALQQQGIRHAMIDTGETGFLGQAPNGKDWRVRIEDAIAQPGQPDQVRASRGPLLRSDGRAMATSSDAHTVFTEDRRYHHILDPRTGYSPQHWSSVTVLAPSCAKADALTKVFFMLPPSRIQAECERWGVDVVLQDKAGQWRSSRGAATLLDLG